MSGRRSSIKTRKNPPVSEQPQQPPQAVEEAQEVEEEGPSLAELTVPHPPKMAVARDVEKRARQGTRGSVEHGLRFEHPGVFWHPCSISIARPVPSVDGSRRFIQQPLEGLRVMCVLSCETETLQYYLKYDVQNTLFL